MPALWWQGGLLAIAVVLQFSPAVGWAPALTLPRPGVGSLSARHPSTGFPRKDFQARGRGLFSDSTAISRGSLCAIVATSKEGPSAESMSRSEEVAELKRRLAQREEEIRAMAAQRRASSEEQRARKRLDILAQSASRAVKQSKGQKSQGLETTEGRWAALPARIRGAYRIERSIGEGSYGEVLLASLKSKSEGDGAQDVSPFLVEGASDGAAPIEAPMHCAIKLIRPRAGEDLNHRLEHHGALSPREAAEVAEQVVKALRDIHAAGFVYRDMKPQNIIETVNEGQMIYRLIDFGSVTGMTGCLFGDMGQEEQEEEGFCRLDSYGDETARRLRSVFRSMDVNGDGQLSGQEIAQCFKAVGVRPDLGKVRRLIARYEARDGSGIDEAAFMDLFGELVSVQDSATPTGTFSYMAPEQFRDGAALTSATDFYGLGATLFKLLSGRLPHEPAKDLSWRPGGRTIWDERDDWRRLICGEAAAPPPLDQLPAEVPRELRDFIGRCLAKLPSERFDDAEDALDALRSISWRDTQNPGRG